MTEWITDQAPYSFRGIDGKTTELYAFGAMDPLNVERPQIVFENLPGNEGFAANTPQGLNRCIERMSQSMNAHPSEVDWYHRDEMGILRAVEIEAREETIENRGFVSLRNSGDLRPEELAKAKRHFPDEKVTRVEADFRDLSQSEVLKLGDAFGPEGPTMRQQPNSVRPDETPSRPHVDLSQESFNPNFGAPQRPSL